MTRYPIAVHTGEANAQHYEVPARFFELTLGPRRKYSCCYYDAPETTLAQAEIARAGGDRRARRARGRPGHSGAWMRLGLALAVHGARNTRRRASPPSPTPRASAGTSRREARALGVDNLTRRHGGHERFHDVGAVRSHRLGRDVRAYVELARTPDAAAARLARTGRPALHPHLHPSRSALSLRSCGQVRLDRAAFLHRRHHAEPRADPKLRRSLRCRRGMALERPPLSAHGAPTGSRNFDANRGEIDAVLRETYGADAGALAQALAAVLPGDGRALRRQQRRGMGRQPLPPARRPMADAVALAAHRTIMRPPTTR